MCRSILAICLIVSFTSLNAQEVKPQRQFDFWIGEWEVTDSEQVIATSVEQFLVDSSIIMENYSQSDGYTGKSINFYDRYLKKWRQTWVDHVGNVSEFIGEYRDGAMVFEGETHRASGKKILRKMIFYNLGPDKVRQYSEMSLDNGKNWQIAYDFIYIRKH
ncbi:hypothetical protein K1X84_04620 [bacterium]|nr:hypothetical protein [bacterium]